MNERSNPGVVKVSLADIMEASANARVIQVPEIVDEYGRPVTPYGAGNASNEKRHNYGRMLRAAGVATVALAAFGLVFRFVGGGEQKDGPEQSASVAIGSSSSGLDSAESTDEFGAECIAKPSSYELKGTDWQPVAKVSVNGWTPMYMDFDTYKVTNPTSILARFAGDMQILAKIDPDGMSLDDEATKASGIYTINLDPAKIQYKTDLTELESGPSALDETAVFEQLIEQYNAAGDESLPKPTMEDAQNLIALVRSTKGDIEAYNIGLLKTLSQEMYGAQIPEEAVAVLGKVLKNDAITDQCIPEKEILFKFSNTPPELDLQPREYGDTEQVDFVTEEFSANIVGVGASGKQLTNEGSTE